jgi:hypothetical protein
MPVMSASSFPQWQTRPPICGKLLAAGVLVLACQPELLACPVCFQVERSATTDGVQAAVFVLMGVTGVVLSGLGVFIVKFWRRS